MSPTITKHLRGKPMISFMYLPLISLAEQVMRSVDQVMPIPTYVQNIYQNVLLPGSKQQIPVSGLLSVAGPRVEWKMEISPALIGVIARGALLGFQKFQQRAKQILP